MSTSHMRNAAVFIAIIISIFIMPHSVGAMDFYKYVELGITPIPCSGNTAVTCPETLSTQFDDSSNPNAPAGFEKFYTQYNSTVPPLIPATGRSHNQLCATAYAPNPSPSPVGTNNRPFIEKPEQYHFWAEDQEITALGKSAERARQFITWTISHNAVDQALSLRTVWGVSRNVAVSFMIVIAAVFGLAIIVSRKMNTGYKFSAQSSIMKIGLSMLFIVLSATIMFTLVAFSEIIMKFFIETLGGKDVFNTFYGARSNEWNYASFVGCRDLNIRVQEAADAQSFLIKMTNVTYYVMGTMLILRKVLLWFLLFVSPFLPLLLSFPLIRNTGRIWIGVFFQWLFYGPLFALFFGATARMFQDGIPFIFDFSRVEKTIGYVFPTAIFITYGGPAQAVNALNNGNYVDTFMEYVITLIMWWAAIWFPWWLLRIYRDYCCDGIYSMRNTLLGFMDKIGKTPPNHPDHPPGRPPVTPKVDLQVSPQLTQNTLTRMKLENPNTVRQAQTESLVGALNLRATTLKDIARIETNSSVATAAKQNLALLENPLAANTATDRQTYLNLRTELFTRASTKNDTFAARILSTTNKASQSYMAKRSELTQSMNTIVSNMQASTPVNLSTSSATTHKVSAERITRITQTIINNITTNHHALQEIAAGSKVSTSAVKSILNAYTKNIDAPFTSVVTKIAESTQLTKEKVSDVLRETQVIMKRAQVMGKLAQTVIPDKIHAQAMLGQIDKLMTGVSEKANAIGSQMVIKIAQLILNIIQKDGAITQIISDKTHTAADKVTSALQALSTAPTANATVLADLATKVGLSRESIQDIVVEAAKVVQSKTPLALGAVDSGSGAPLDAIVRTTLSSGIMVEASAPEVEVITSEFNTLFSDSKVVAVTQAILKETGTDEQIIATIQATTALSKKQIMQTLEMLSTSPSITDATSLTKLETTAGVDKIKALQVVREAIRHANVSKEVSVAPDGTPEELEITRMLEAQLETALDPDSQIDLAIPLDPASQEEYEEIKNLWIQQYAMGEVPESDVVKSRLDWVSNDAETITSILRKLISKDEQDRQRALDEVGFILPVFLMNNLTGTQLITYLKAKVTAAKSVRADLEKSAAFHDEELSVVRRVGPAEENTKHLEVDEATGESRTAEEGGKTV